MAVTIDQGPHDGPDTIVPGEHSPKRSFGQHVHHIVKAFTTKDGLVGDYDYGMGLVLDSRLYQQLTGTQAFCSNQIFPS